MKISLGIHIPSNPERLDVTLASLEENTTPLLNVVLLVDGADANTQTVLKKFGYLKQITTAVSRGAPYLFNRLLGDSQADLYIFLENGAAVGPGWLDRMLSALAADPQNGLVGPSTNRSWNEQGVFPQAKGNPNDIAQTAVKAIKRFGASWQLLTPLYSLADFCFAVNKEVVAAIGGADESYGRGPCWEMDYNIRAARAGFHGVWACGAYVYRQPFTRQRRRQEAQLYTRNKQLYQEHFCGRRLRGEWINYKSHCRGDACPNFAPSDLIQMKIPLPSNIVIDGSAEEVHDGIGIREEPACVPENSILLDSEKTAHPLVSCIMPTRDRPDFAMQAVDYFLRQDYPERELIIVDDSLNDWQGLLPKDPRIRYYRTRRDESIGVKRNRACELARGEIIVHWDDDDWYAPHRIRVQVEPLLAQEADISGLTDTVFFELDTWQFWRCKRPLHRRLFVENVHGGTLTYWRYIWQERSRFPDRSIAEDAIFLRRAVRRGARVKKLSNVGLFLYVRHKENSWSFSCGRYLDPSGWQQTEEPTLSEADRAFYARHSPAYSSKMERGDPSLPAQEISIDLPLVSCIMPTADRRPFVPQAIDCFLQQDYPSRELIIVDDGADEIVDLIPNEECIRYFRLDKRESIGSKRNFACQHAKGEIIVH